MRERPILMSPWSVERILANAKTQTRRVVRGEQPQIVDIRPKHEKWTWGFWHDNHFPNGKVVRCPYGKPGDHLWVRETTKSYPIPNLLTGEPTNAIGAVYAADNEPLLTKPPDLPDFDVAWWYSKPTCPAIFMPRWASRITLEITDIRVQRVQEISEEDAVAEGCEAEIFTKENIADAQISDQYTPEMKKLAAALGPGRFTAKMEYAMVWDEINGNGHPWSSNPFCWCISFRRLETQ